jgi:hypothetical protein
VNYTSNAIRGSFCLVCCLCVLVSACASSTRVGRGPAGSISSLVRADQHDLEVAATTEDQARDEVLLTPTVFAVAFADDEYSWERARFFLENYVNTGAGHTSSVTKVVGEEWSLESNPAAPAYRYVVSKRSGDGAFTYTVTCEPGAGGTAAQAALNAGNFARFIRDGKLEVSLLQGQQ